MICEGLMLGFDNRFLLDLSWNDSDLDLIVIFFVFFALFESFELFIFFVIFAVFESFELLIFFAILALLESFVLLIFFVLFAPYWNLASTYCQTYTKK